MRPLRRLSLTRRLTTMYAAHVLTRELERRDRADAKAKEQET